MHASMDAILATWTLRNIVRFQDVRKNKARLKSGQTESLSSVPHLVNLGEGH